MPSTNFKTQSTEKTTSPLIGKWNFDELRYSFVWEDFKCLEAALGDTKSGGHFLSIGSAGHNALGLLKLNPTSIDIIDISRAQIALLELTISGIQNLDHVEFLNLLGYKTELPRTPLFNKCQSQLSPSSLSFWETHSSSIEDGIQGMGRLDTYFSKFRSEAFPYIWPEEIFTNMIFAKNSTEQTFWFNKGNMTLLKDLAGRFFDKTPFSSEGRHSSQFKYVEKEDISTDFVYRLEKLISNSLISDNPYLYYFFTGQALLNSNTLPLWSEADFLLIKSRIERVRIINSDIESHLSKIETRYDFFNLSDLFEYLSPKETQHLFESIWSKSRPNAKVCYWNLVVDREPPRDLFKILPIGSLDQVWFYKRFFHLEKNHKLD